LLKALKQKGVKKTLVYLFIYLFIYLLLKDAVSSSLFFAFIVIYFYIRSFVFKDRFEFCLNTVLSDRWLSFLSLDAQVQTVG
jgi:hypothetical protein